ncbi:MAG TPA: hypothetical protein VGA42_03365 [Gemmatimonadales bacterium]
MLPRSLACLALLGLVSVSDVLAQARRASPAAPGTAIDTALYAQLRYRHIGPEGNRVSSVAGVPGDRRVYYAGAASGGIFKTTDAGLHWRPIFDAQPVSSIGALAVAPSDPNVVWAGTGENAIRSNISLGWGVFKSTDAGKTWARAGLEHTGRIGRITIHPQNSEIVFMAAIGHAYGPQPERGVYRTTDGGRTWERVLFVDENTGAYAVEMDPNNPRILFASTWQFVINTWGRMSGGPGSGIWKSTDGGTTWKRLTGNGLPTKPFGKVDLAVARTNPNRVYALIETSDGVPLPGVEAERGELWRSDDGGTNWQLVSYDRNLAGRTQYYTRMAVLPDDEHEAYFLSASWTKTLDGGKTSIDPPFEETPGWDHHDIWIDPTDANRMIVSHDGGVSITENRGKTWFRVALPIAQMYHVTVDDRVPYYVYGNRQDGPSARGPSNSKMGGFFGDAGIPRGLWATVGGGESGWATPDPADSNWVWSSASGFGSLGGIVSRYNVETGIAHNVEVWPEMTAGHPASEIKYRFQWTFPLTVSPHDPKKVYVGSQHIHVTTDGGNSWQVMSPDLTRNDKSRQAISGGLTPDNIGVEYAGVVFAIAESPVQAGLIWAGTNDGVVQLTRDGGRTWATVTPAGMLEWGTISNIEPSRYDVGTAYLTVDGHQVNSRDPWVYKTSDFGRSWKLVVGGLTKTPLSYAHFVKEDPVRRGLLYLGTEGGLHVSFNDGESWQPLQTNLPHAPVYGLAVQQRFSDLAVATYGRGMWILDDITPLRTLPEVASQDVHLFAPREAWRFRGVEAPFAPIDDPVTGANPPYGAAINYWLKSAAAEKDSVAITIQDASGKAVRTLKGTKTAGLNRVWWDLRSEPSKEARVRNSPLYTPEITVPDTGRAAPSVGRVSRLVPPGTYTIKLSVAGRESTQLLVVRKDPNSGGSEAEIRERTTLFDEVQRELEGVVDMINRSELVRSQLRSLKATLGGDSVTADVRAAADSLAEKVVGLEENLLQLRITGRGQDVIRYPAKLAEKLAYLAGDISGADYAPTGSQREVARALAEHARSLKSQFDQLMSRDVEAFNAMLRARNLQHIVTR